MMSVRKKLDKVLSKLPYYKTAVDTGNSETDIIKLLNKYGIKDRLWADINGRKILRFFFADIDGMKRMVELELPELIDRDNRLVPAAQTYRIFYHSLKGLLEASAYGIITKDEVFLANTMLKLSDGTLKKYKYIRPSGAVLALPENISKE
jgi:hypothetical protein